MCCFPNWLVREQSKTIRLKVGGKLLITEDHIPNIVFIFSSPRLKQNQMMPSIFYCHVLSFRYQSNDTPFFVNFKTTVL